MMTGKGGAKGLILPGRLVWPVVEPPDCPPCKPRSSGAMRLPTTNPWAAIDAAGGEPDPVPAQEDELSVASLQHDPLSRRRGSPEG